jgi:hypothetical protein
MELIILWCDDHFIGASIVTTGIYVTYRASAQEFPAHVEMRGKLVFAIFRRNGPQTVKKTRKEGLEC